MKWKRTIAEYQMCPRCGLKCPMGNDICPDCGLSFSRLKIATNKEAKDKILRHDRDFIIRTSTLPSDVSFLRLLLYSIFFGMLGVHCFYVGRYLRGSMILGDFIAIFLLVVFNASLVQINDGSLLGILSTICGLIMLAWVWDVFMIIFKKFKVPVAIDLNIEKLNAINENREDISNNEESNSKNNIDINQNNKEDATKHNDEVIDKDLKKQKIENNGEIVELLIQEGKTIKVEDEIKIDDKNKSSHDD